MRYERPLNLFCDLVKSNVETRGRLLGLDVGEKYVGLAVSDQHNKISLPLRYDISFAWGQDHETVLKIVIDNFSPNGLSYFLCSWG